MTRSTRAFRASLALALAGPLVLVAAGLAAQEEEEPEQPPQPVAVFQEAVLPALQGAERRQMTARWQEIRGSGAERAHKDGRFLKNRGQWRALKVETPAATAAPSQFALADQAVHGFLVQALAAARLDALAQQVRALPAVQNAASARGARARLARLLRVVDRRARPALEATIATLAASLGRDAGVATARSLARVVTATLNAGAPRTAVLARVEAIGRGDLAAGR